MHLIGLRKMRNLVEHIINKEYDSANQVFESEIENVARKKLAEAKKITAAKMSEQVPAFMGAAGSNAVKLRRGVLESQHSNEKEEEDEDENDDDEKLDEARIKILKARVRGGKVQRRKKISNVEGFKLQDGKLKRMSPAERRRRKLGQKRGKLKRRTKMRQALMKRKRSLKRRSAIGL